MHLLDGGPTQSFQKSPNGSLANRELLSEIYCSVASGGAGANFADGGNRQFCLYAPFSGRECTNDVPRMNYVF